MSFSNAEVLEDDVQHILHIHSPSHSPQLSHGTAQGLSGQHGVAVPHLVQVGQQVVQALGQVCAMTRLSETGAAGQGISTPATTHTTVMKVIVRPRTTTHSHLVSLSSKDYIRVESKLQSVSRLFCTQVSQHKIL